MSRGRGREQPESPGFPPRPTITVPPQSRGVDHETIARAVRETDFCLFCGAPAEPGRGGLRCGRHAHRCIDPDCHKTASRSCGRPKPETRERRSRATHPETPTATIAASESEYRWWGDAAGTAFCCPCCLVGCARSENRNGGFSLMRLLNMDAAAGRSRCLTYRYQRLDKRGHTFGMTYAPDERTRQRASADIEPAFQKRLDRLDWLSSSLDDRHWAYFLECYIKRLEALVAASCQATLKTDPLATLKTDPRRNGVCRSTTTIPWSIRTAPPGRWLRSSALANPAVRGVPASVVDGRDAPSRPGRKAHNCHPSRGAGGVSPEGPEHRGGRA